MIINFQFNVKDQSGPVNIIVDTDALVEPLNCESLQQHVCNAFPELNLHGYYFSYEGQRLDDNALTHIISQCDQRPAPSDNPIIITVTNDKTLNDITLMDLPIELLTFIVTLVLPTDDITLAAKTFNNIARINKQFRAIANDSLIKGPVQLNFNRANYPNCDTLNSMINTTNAILRSSGRAPSVDLATCFSELQTRFNKSIQKSDNSLLHLPIFLSGILNDEECALIHNAYQTAFVRTDVTEEVRNAARELITYLPLNDIPNLSKLQHQALLEALPNNVETVSFDEGVHRHIRDAELVNNRDRYELEEDVVDDVDDIVELEAILLEIENQMVALVPVPERVSDTLANNLSYLPTRLRQANNGFGTMIIRRTEQHGRPALPFDIVAALKHEHANVREVTLQCCHLTDPRDFAALGEVIGLGRLRSLSFVMQTSTMGLMQNGLTHIAEALKNPNNQLQHLVFADTKLGILSPILNALTDPHCQLKTLTLCPQQYSPLTFHAVKTLCTAIEQGSALDSLSIGLASTHDRGIIKSDLPSILLALRSPERRLHRLNIRAVNHKELELEYVLLIAMTMLYLEEQERPVQIRCDLKTSCLTNPPHVDIENEPYAFNQLIVALRNDKINTIAQLIKENGLICLPLDRELLTDAEVAEIQRRISDDPLDTIITPGARLTSFYPSGIRIASTPITLIDNDEYGWGRAEAYYRSYESWKNIRNPREDYTAIEKFIALELQMYNDPRFRETHRNYINQHIAEARHKRDVDALSQAPQADQPETIRLSR